MVKAPFFSRTFLGRDLGGGKGRANQVPGTIPFGAPTYLYSPQKGKGAPVVKIYCCLPVLVLNVLATLKINAISQYNNHNVLEVSYEYTFELVLLLP